MIVGVWRSFAEVPLTRNHFALCDDTTVDVSDRIEADCYSKMFPKTTSYRLDASNA